MFAEDRGWLARLDEAIASGLSAEGAVLKVQNDARARMSQVVDPYLRERLADLDELADRLLRHLAGGGGGRAAAGEGGGDRPQPGPGRASGIRPQAPAGHHPGGGLAHRPCRHRRPRPRPAR